MSSKEDEDISESVISQEWYTYSTLTKSSKLVAVPNQTEVINNTMNEKDETRYNNPIDDKNYSIKISDENVQDNRQMAV